MPSPSTTSPDRQAHRHPTDPTSSTAADRDETPAAAPTTRPHERRHRPVPVYRDSEHDRRAVPAASDSRDRVLLATSRPPRSGDNRELDAPRDDRGEVSPDRADGGRRFPSVQEVADEIGASPERLRSFLKTHPHVTPGYILTSFDADLRYSDLVEDWIEGVRREQLRRTQGDSR